MRQVEIIRGHGRKMEAFLVWRVEGRRTLGKLILVMLLREIVEGDFRLVRSGIGRRPGRV